MPAAAAVMVAELNLSAAGWCPETAATCKMRSLMSRRSFGLSAAAVLSNGGERLIAKNARHTIQVTQSACDDRCQNIAPKSWTRNEKFAIWCALACVSEKK